MSGIYENIAPTISLRNFKGKNIVQTIAFDRIPNGNILKRNYIGLAKYGQVQIFQL